LLHISSRCKSHTLGAANLRTINRRGIELTAFWLRAFAQKTGNFPQRAAHSTPTLQDSAEIRSSARAQALRTNL
jgi:hypothetical protein